LEVKVRYFAAHREAAGVATEDVTVPLGTTVGQLLDELVLSHPALKALVRDTVVSVNRGVGTVDTVLEPGDDVALLQPITGG
jgi:molybdopterin converting factor small subunit